MTPHGFCIRWDPAVLYPMLVGDVLLFVAYTFIAIMLMILLQRPFGRITAPLKPFFYLFALFIGSCAVTHLAHIVVVYVPLYSIEASLLLFAGIVSAMTAGMIARIFKERDMRKSDTYPYQDD